VLAFLPAADDTSSLVSARVWRLAESGKWQVGGQGEAKRKSEKEEEEKSSLKAERQS